MLVPCEAWAAGSDLLGETHEGGGGGICHPLGRFTQMEDLRLPLASEDGLTPTPRPCCSGNQRRPGTVTEGRVPPGLREPGWSPCRSPGFWLPHEGGPCGACAFLTWDLILKERCFWSCSSSLASRQAEGMKAKGMEVKARMGRGQKLQLLSLFP